MIMRLMDTRLNTSVRYIQDTFWYREAFPVSGCPTADQKFLGSNPAVGRIQLINIWSSSQLLEFNIMG